MSELGTLGTKKLPRSAIVIGAGVVGVATAYALARRGVAVTILEKADGPAQGASFANGAQLSYCYTEALASPALLRRIPVLALGLDPAFRLNPRLNVDSIGWLIRFMMNSTEGRFQANTLAGLALGLEARLAMQELLDRHHLDFDHETPGKMLIYENVDAFASSRKMIELKRKNGAVQEALSPAEAIALEPALLARKEGFVGAVYAAQEAVGDPRRFCEAMLPLLAKEYGVDIRLNTRVSNWKEGRKSVTLSTSAGEHLDAEQIVLCAGIEARLHLKRLGLGSALMAMKGYSFTAPRGETAPSMSITDVARKIVFCPLGGNIRVAGLAELGARNTEIDQRRLKSLTDAAAAALPKAADYAAVQGGWAGLRPMTANSLPIMRRTSPRVTINIGHGMLGWTYAMGSAERVAHLMEEWA
jgi:D-amino-acid dehydrogenase